MESNKENVSKSKFDWDMTVYVLPKFKLKNKFNLLKFIDFISFVFISEGISNSYKSFDVLLFESEINLYLK